MIREVIVTSPAGVRLCFEASGEKGLAIETREFIPSMMAVLDRDRAADVGLVPTSWLIELNAEAT